MMKKTVFLFMLLMTLMGTASVSACGGLFCQTIPVDQQAERIIFTVNDDDTLSAYVQINYTGDAPDFSWVVPVPSVPEVDVAEIESFDELSNLTAPIFIPPLISDCDPELMPVPSVMAMMEDTGGGVDVLASGTAGPYVYDVITSPNPQEMIDWLCDNDYRITEDMEPLIAVYNDEGMVFLAMKLQPEQGVQDIQPVVMTYESTRPMIPLRLTAVAANPNMTVLTWIFADHQTQPTNYAYPTIKDEDIRGDFSSFSGTNYEFILDATIDLYDGHAFVTEYAMPTSDLRAMNPSDPLVKLLAEKYSYVTRHIGRISPEEMTVDPIFTQSDELPDVSNIHDLSEMETAYFWNCGETRPIELQYDPDVVPEGFGG